MKTDVLPLPGADPAAPIYRTERGVSALLAGQMTCYFDTLPDDAAGLVRAYRRVAAFAAEHWTWYRSDSIRRSRALLSTDIEALPTWFAGARRRREYELVFGAGASPGEIGDWGLNFALEPPALPEVQGYFQFYVPAEWLLANPRSFEQLTRGVFDDFGWRLATAGLGIAFDADDIDPKRDAAIHAYARRYIGVDCNDLLAESELPAGTLKSVNWLTFLSPTMTAAAVRLPLPPTQLHVELLANGGSVVRAGERPVLGDVNRRADVSAYAQADLLLRPLRSRRMWPLPGFQDEDEVAEWLARFETSGDDDERTEDEDEA